MTVADLPEMVPDCAAPGRECMSLGSPELVEQQLALLLIVQWLHGHHAKALPCVAIVLPATAPGRNPT